MDYLRKDGSRVEDLKKEEEGKLSVEVENELEIIDLVGNKVEKIINLVLDSELPGDDSTTLDRNIDDQIYRRLKKDQENGCKSLVQRTDLDFQDIAKDLGNLTQASNVLEKAVEQLEYMKNQNAKLKDEIKMSSLRLEGLRKFEILPFEGGHQQQAHTEGGIGMEPTPTTCIDATDSSSLSKEHANERVKSMKRHEQKLQVVESSPTKKKWKRKVEEMATGSTNLETIRNMITSSDLTVEELSRVKETLNKGKQKKQKKQKRVEEKGYDVYIEQTNVSWEVIYQNLEILDKGLSNSLKAVRNMIEIEKTENVKLNDEKQTLVWRLQIHGSSGIVLSDGQSTLTSSEGNHNSVSMPQPREHQQIQRGGLASKSTMGGHEGFHTMQRQQQQQQSRFHTMQRHQGNFQGRQLGAMPQAWRYQHTESNNSLPVANAFNPPPPTTVTNLGDLRHMTDGNHQQMPQAGMSQLRGPFTSFGFTASSSNSMMRGHEEIQSMQQRQQGSFQDIGMAYNGETTNSTNCNKGLVKELEEGITVMENKFPIKNQVIEQNLKSNQQFQQPYVPVMNPTPRNIFEEVQQASQSGAIPQAANPAFAATSSAPAVIPPSEDHGGMLEPRLTLEDLELPEGFPPWSPSDMVSFDELLSRFPSPDSEWNQETPVFETNQTPNTFFGAPDFTLEGDSERTE